MLSCYVYETCLGHLHVTELSIVKCSCFLRISTGKQDQTIVSVMKRSERCTYLNLDATVCHGCLEVRLLASHTSIATVGCLLQDKDKGDAVNKLSNTTTQI